MKPCKHNTTTVVGCHMCWLFDNDERYRALWSRTAITPAQLVSTPAVKQDKLVDCIHLGDPTNELVQCIEGCSGRLKVFACAIHGKATISKRGAGIEGRCKGCPDVKPDVPMKLQRHEWAYGVTTVLARRHDLLPQTLRSLRDAGFDNPRLFVDGAKDDAEYKALGYETTTHWPALKTFGNWITAMWELLVRNPACDRFALFQDDIIVCRDLRAYLDNTKWPAHGYLNLYTFPQNQAIAPLASAGRVGSSDGSDRVTGWYEAQPYTRGPLYYSKSHGKEVKGQTGLGAVALCFTRDAVLDMLSSRHAVERPLSVAWSTAKVDGCIVTAMNKAGWREYVHNPSLVQHTGKVSTMGNKPHPSAPSFKGETWSALELICALPHSSSVVV